MGRSTKSKAPSKAPLKERLETASRAGSAALTIVILAAAVLGVSLGARHLEARAAKSVKVEPVRVVFDWPAIVSSKGRTDQTWMPPNNQAELINLARRDLLADASPFHADALEAVGRDLLRTGWFEKLTAVRRDPGGVVKVEGVWRIPAAVVRQTFKDGDIDLLVGQTGELLIASFEPDTAKLPVIYGVKNPAPRDERGRLLYGERWGGGEVQAGLSLLGALNGRAYWNQIKGVDVARYAAEKRLDIVTDKGKRVVWGCAPSDALVTQIPASMKLQHLDALYASCGRIDADRDRVELFSNLVVVDSSASAGKP
jgi:hypothetical protein